MSHFMSYVMAHVVSHVVSHGVSHHAQRLHQLPRQSLIFHMNVTIPSLQECQVSMCCRI